MNNKEFLSELSTRSGYSVQNAQKLTDTVIQILSEQLCDGNLVSVQGFGNLEVKKKMERVMVSPITKKRMLVPPKLTVSFKPSISLKDKLK
ncbi:MAG: HU family DNA-binding protein [Bacteroidaceae bacterium]|nr:HU family DNA-binding protein [Bacteroidaceae bacterium]